MDTLLATLFNLNTFLVICIVAALGLQVRTWKPQYLMVLFAVLGVCAMLTIRAYWSPPQRIFANTDHHVLEHLGFRFQSKLILVDGANPNRALWDTKLGYLALSQHDLPSKTSYVLQDSGFVEPIFTLVATKEDDKSFRLANPSFHQPVHRTVSFRIGDSLTVELAIQPMSNSKALYRYQLTTPSKTWGWDTIPFQNQLKIGHSIGGLLARASSEAPEFSDVISTLDSVWLLRERVGFQHDTASALLLFAAPGWYTSRGQIRIDGRPASSPAKISYAVPLSPKQWFFTGLLTTHTQQYQVTPHGQLNDLLFLMPDRKPFKSSRTPEQVSMFLTSALPDMVDQPGRTGYYYPLLERDDNLHHITASLSYQTGPTREPLRVHFVPNEQEHGLADESVWLSHNDTVTVRSKGIVGTNKKTPLIYQPSYWLFRLNDAKRTNALDFAAILLLIGLVTTGCLVAVAISRVEAFHYAGVDLGRQSAEWVVYVVLLAFVTVRLVLLWRTSTFLPLDTVTFSEYNRLAELGWKSYWETTICIAGFWIIILSIKQARGHANNRFLELGTRMNKLFRLSSPLRRQSGLWLLIYVALITLRASVGGASGFARLTGVLIPLLVYIWLEFYFLQRAYAISTETRPFKVRLYRQVAALNWLLCFGFFARFDAGFSILFGFFTIIYWWLRLFLFTDHQSIYASGSWRNRRKRIWGWLVPPVGIFAYILATPYLLAWAFGHPLQIIGLTAISAGVGIYLLTPSSNRTKWGLIGGSVAALLIAGAGWLLSDRIENLIRDEARIRYRAEVLIGDPDNVLTRTFINFRSSSEIKLREAAQNQWLINYFFFKQPNSFSNYFQLASHFNTGSPHLTQIADLVVVRYVIAEHGEWIIRALILLLLLLTMATTRGSGPYAQLKIRVLLACLLFSVALAIWLTATNRMVFVGQDFPLLSLNSRLTLSFTFGILFVIVLLSQPQPGVIKESPFKSSGRLVLGRFLLPAMVFSIAVLGHLILFQSRDLKLFKLDQTMASLSMAISEWNTAFTEYQRNHIALNRSPFDWLRGFDSTQHLTEKLAFYDTRQPFLRSAYLALADQLSSHNTPRELLYLKRDSRGFYQIGLNRWYYTVLSPDANRSGWQGDVVAVVDSSRSFSLKATKQGKIIPIPTQKMAHLSALTAPTTLNIKMATLPAGWTSDSLPVVMVANTPGEEMKTRGRFLIKTGGSVIESRQSSFTTLLKPGDLLQFINQKNSTVTSFRYQQVGGSYLARNYWLNGRPQFVYPLRDRFLWGYHFTKLAKAALDQQPDKLDLVVQTTLDLSLMDSLRSIVKGYYEQSSSKNQRGKAFSMVVLDHRGNIRSLTDYKAGMPVAIDPNRLGRYQELFDQLELTSQPSEERLLLSNRCLMRLDNGPASTFKPILYSAITSQYNFDWSKLRFNGIDADVLSNPHLVSRSGTDFTLHYYGGSALRFTVGEGNEKPHDNIRYISHSTNMYNSLVLTLGSFSPAELSVIKKDFQTGSDNNAYFGSGRSLDNRRNVPLFQYQDHVYHLRRFPDWSLPHSSIGKGLRENFRFSTSSDEVNSLKGTQSVNLAPGLNDDPNCPQRQWCFPEPSHLYLIDRSITLQNAIAQCATGAYPITATPLKMAEMAGKLFSFNQSYKARVWIGSPTKTAPLGFSVHPSWGSPARLTEFYSRSLFEGMHQAVEEGTARWLQSAFRQTPYFVYAKTGTISGNRRGGGLRDKHILLIISHDQLHRVSLTPEKMQRNRFYVIYLSFYKHSEDGKWDSAADVVRKLVQTVLNTTGFKATMQ